MIYRFKVSLYDDESIFRELEICDGDSLEELHDLIFRAFDRYDEHLYSFFLTREEVDELDGICRFPEYTHPEMITPVREEGCGEQFSAADVALRELKLNVDDRLYYLFDYGDQWWHELLFLGEVEGSEDECPQIVNLSGESPPQYPNDEEDEYYDEEDDYNDETL